MEETTQIFGREHIRVLAWEYGIGLRGKALLQKLLDDFPGLHLQVDELNDWIAAHRTEFEKAVRCESRRRQALREQARKSLQSNLLDSMADAALALQPHFDILVKEMYLLDMSDEGEKNQLLSKLATLQTMSAQMSDWTEMSADRAIRVAREVNAAKMNLELQKLLLTHSLRTGQTKAEDLPQEAITILETKDDFPDLVDEDDSIFGILAVANDTKLVRPPPVDITPLTNEPLPTE